MTKLTLRNLIDIRQPLPIEIVVAQHMAGMKKAMWDGYTLHVSPAMYSMLGDDEMVEKVASVIDVVYIPRFDPFDMPMITLPPQQPDIQWKFRPPF